MKKSLLIVTILANTIAVSAQKIDFDINGRHTNEVTASGCTSWMVAQQASAEKTFNNVNIKIETLTKGEQLHAQWNKEDVCTSLLVVVLSLIFISSCMFN